MSEITCYHNDEVISMKRLRKLVNERYAKPAAKFMRITCYLAILILLLCLILSLMGRQSFRLRTSTGTYENAIYAEENHAPQSRSLTVHMNDDVYVWANDDDQIELSIHIGLSLMFAFNVVPLILAFWFLSRVFTNISRGEIFTEQNAFYLLYYGLLQIFTAVFVPFIKLLICYLVNLIADGRINLATGKEMLSSSISGIVFIVAAYIIHYGIHLQDEVDHTL